ncbi:hypothetical protein F4810DRAFT_658928 [Camillea tinctor]|nr:hypothetical protein F4810DRAFT_658928 [Camillea tinctor]
MADSKTSSSYALYGVSSDIEHSPKPAIADAAAPRTLLDTPPTTESLIPLLSPSRPSTPPRARFLPPVTTGTSDHYVAGTTLAVTRANLADPLTLKFLKEITGEFSVTGTLPYYKDEEPEPGTTTPPSPYYQKRFFGPLHMFTNRRLQEKVEKGALIAEAADFAAVAVWELLGLGDAAPQNCDTAMLASSPSKFDPSERPAYTSFAAQVHDFKREEVDPVAKRTGGVSWHVCLTARDPGRKKVEGAVRAVLVPFMRRAAGPRDEDEEEEETGEKMQKGPVWLEASSENSRDVYAHFGFKVVRVMEVMGINTYGMMYTGSLLEGKD